MSSATGTICVVAQRRERWRGCWVPAWMAKSLRVPTAETECALLGPEDGVLVDSAVHIDQ